MAFNINFNNNSLITAGFDKAVQQVPNVCPADVASSYCGVVLLHGRMYVSIVSLIVDPLKISAFGLTVIKFLGLWVPNICLHDPT